MHPDTLAALGALHRNDLDAEANRHSVAQSASGRRAEAGVGPSIAASWSRILGQLTARLGRSPGPVDAARATNALAGQGTIGPAAWVEPTDRSSVIVDRQRLAGRIGEVRGGDW